MFHLFKFKTFEHVSLTVLLLLQELFIQKKSHKILKSMEDIDKRNSKFWESSVTDGSFKINIETKLLINFITYSITRCEISPLLRMPAQSGTDQFFHIMWTLEKMGIISTNLKSQRESPNVAVPQLTYSGVS